MQSHVHSAVPDQCTIGNACGDFNNWDKTSTPMKQAKDGRWQVDVKLEAGREYQFRYFVNEDEWHNDGNADKYAAHPYGGENSAVIT